MSKQPLSEDEKSVIEQFMIPFFNLYKHFPLFPGKFNKQAEADLLGVSATELSQYRENLDENARQAALELLKEDEITDLIDKLPFDGEETIVAIGDSITEDGQGWFEILKHLLEIGTENAAYTFVNAGKAYDTTTDALRRLDRDVLLHNPDWVIVALGTFDAQRLNIAQNRTLIPLAETWENLSTIQDSVSEKVENPVIWITPTPVIGELLETNPIYEFTFDEHDITEIQNIIAGKTGGIVDPRATRMGEHTEAWNYLGDGLHHSLSGHMQTVRELLKTMAEVAAKNLPED